jgi:Ca2+-binding RTX toxin-like protein
VLTGPGASNGFGNALANLMVGNDAANVLDGGPQGTAGDTMQGGGGDDTYIVDRTSDRAIETTTLAGHVDAGGLDLVRSSVTYTLGDFVENLSLNGSSSIRGTGNALANWINGNAADNLLSGAAGDDTIVGHAGDDTLNGGAGNDRLSGSAGADIFRFSSALDSVTNVDTILWFDASEDGIQLNDAVFENIGPTGTLAAGAFAIGTAATQADDRVIYDPTTGHLLYDADGSGAAQAVLFAVLAPNTELSALDFFVI